MVSIPNTINAEMTFSLNNEKDACDFLEGALQELYAEDLVAREAVQATPPTPVMMSADNEDYLWKDDERGVDIGTREPDDEEDGDGSLDKGMTGGAAATCPVLVPPYSSGRPSRKRFCRVGNLVSLCVGAARLSSSSIALRPRLWSPRAERARQGASGCLRSQRTRVL